MQPSLWFSDGEIKYVDLNSWDREKLSFIFAQKYSHPELVDQEPGHVFPPQINGHFERGGLSVIPFDLLVSLEMEQLLGD
jgi:hypothetical protein